MMSKETQVEMTTKVKMAMKDEDHSDSSASAKEDIISDDQDDKTSKMTKSGKRKANRNEMKGNGTSVKVKIPMKDEDPSDTSASAEEDIISDDQDNEKEEDSDAFDCELAGEGSRKIGLEIETKKNNDRGDFRTDYEKKKMLFIGQKFSTFKELDTAKSEYEEKHFCELWKRDVRMLAAAAKRVPKQVQNANEKLKYYSLKLSCKFGGRTVEAREKRNQKTKSFRQGCPFNEYLTLSFFMDSIYKLFA